MIFDDIFVLFDDAFVIFDGILRYFMIFDDILVVMGPKIVKIWYLGCPMAQTSKNLNSLRCSGGCQI